MDPQNPESSPKGPDFPVGNINLPETKKMGKNSLEPARKKCKLDKEETPISSTTIDSLPNEMLIEIFKYLSVRDRLNVQRVSDRWHHLGRREDFWPYVSFSKVTPSFLNELLTSLPSCVPRLKLGCTDEDLPINLPQVMAKLQRQCPFLKTLILENIHLVKNLHRICYYEFKNSAFNTQLFRKVDCKPEVKKLFESEFRKGYVGLVGAILSELKVLSLRHSYFSLSHFHSHISNFVLPKLVVLDLSHSQPTSLSRTTVDFFPTLDGLEELYLEGWDIQDYNLLKFLGNVKKLRVLDVEMTYVSKNTISALKENCKKLEKLYLSCTPVKEICTVRAEKEFFPCLETLCLACTDVTEEGITELLTVCPSLKHVNVSHCINISEEWYDRLPIDLKNRLISESDFGYVLAISCKHFRQTEHYNF